MGHSGFHGDCGGVQGGYVGFGLGFKKEHSIGLGLGFEEEHGYVGFGWVWVLRRSTPFCNLGFGCGRFDLFFLSN